MGTSVVLDGRGSSTDVGQSMPSTRVAQYTGVISRRTAETRFCPPTTSSNAVKIRVDRVV